jgi:S-disulfanyl-L-cysteine oxidoreductase SoxD
VRARPLPTKLSQFRRALLPRVGRGTCLGVALLALSIASAHAADAKLRYGFGKPATAAEIAGWDIDVRPDGTGLPPGRGSVADGQRIYDAKCASCHGTFGESTDYMAIAGGVGTLKSDQPIRTTGSKLNHATTLFDYIRRAMPFNAPKSLSADEVYALTAYVLNLNDILPADAVLDRDAIVAVRMPNRDGFTTRHGLMKTAGTPDTHATACMTNCVAAVRVASVIPEYARDSHGDLARQTRRLDFVDRAAASSGEPVSGTRTGPADLASRAGCMACHGVAKGVVGPAFADVARRYAGNPDALNELSSKVRQGGAGGWGTTPMPPQHVAEADLRAILGWILDRLQ